MSLLKFMTALASPTPICAAWSRKSADKARLAKSWDDFVAKARARVLSVEAALTGENYRSRLVFNATPFGENFMWQMIGEVQIEVHTLEQTAQGEKLTAKDQFFLTFQHTPTGWKESDGHWSREVISRGILLSYRFPGIEAVSCLEKLFCDPPSAPSQPGPSTMPQTGSDVESWLDSISGKRQPPASQPKAGWTIGHSKGRDSATGLVGML
jgi:hypothetical protein